MVGHALGVTTRRIVLTHESPIRRAVVSQLAFILVSASFIIWYGVAK